MQATESTAASADAIEAHMAFLADDLLEGREAGTRGEAVAARYLASVFGGLGLEPLSGDGFLQPVPLRTATLDAASVRLDIGIGDDREAFANGDDIAIFGNPSRTEVNVTAEAVFAGHGVTAPALGQRDYEGLDVAGKIAVVLDGPPAFLPPAEAAYHGSADRQKRAAAEAGAIGLIRVRTPTSQARVPWSVVQAYVPRPVMTWRAEDGAVKAAAPEIALNAIVRGAAADAMFSAVPIDLDDVIERARSGPVGGRPLGVSISLQARTMHDDSQASANVGGMVSGTDPNLDDELVVVTAHYDHVGLCGAADAADRICNGALDNALGTAAMLDVARRFAEGGGARRPVLFLAVGAEEKGLLGSDYFATYPQTGGRKIAAVINMDGGLPFYEFSDVIAFGAEQSQLGEMLAEAVTPLGLTVTGDPFPEQNIFTRSDHYSFVRRGTPSIFLYHGFTDMEGENVGQAIWDEFLATHYHQPSDDLTLPIRYDVAAKYADVFYALTRTVADGDAAPLWYEDSVFGHRFALDEPKTSRPTE